MVWLNVNGWHDITALETWGIRIRIFLIVFLLIFSSLSSLWNFWPSHKKQQSKKASLRRSIEIALHWIYYSQSLYALKELAAHLLGFCGPATESGFGFCQQHLEFPSGLQSKNYSGQMQLNFGVRIGTGYSKVARSADLFLIIFL